MTVDIVQRRARLAAATSGPWSSKIDLLDQDDGLAFTITDATYKMFGILPTEFPNTPAGSASAHKHPAAANAALIVGLVNEESEILDELESLRKWRADQVLCADLERLRSYIAQLEIENVRLRSFRDAVLDHDEDCGECAECASEDGGFREDLARERAERALAKENGNG